MSDLVRFVEAMLAEEENGAEEAATDAGSSWSELWSGVVETADDTINCGDARVSRHIVAHDPARVLADVEATRAILAEHHNVNDGDCSTCVVGLWVYPTHGGSVIARWPCPTVRLIASRWADRPGYRPEWAPVSDTTEETPR